MGEHEDGALVDDAASQVVQQAQARLVGVVHIVDDQEHSGARRGDPHQLGGRHEQPLVHGLAAPIEVATGQGPADLAPVLVAQRVQEGRVPPAEVVERLEHRGVWPWSLHRRRLTAADLPVSPPCEGRGHVEHRGLADAGRPGDQHRGATSVSGGVEDRAQPVAHVTPTEEADRPSLSPSIRASRGNRGSRGRLARDQLLEFGAQQRRPGTGGGAQLVLQGLLEPLELHQRAAPVTAGGEGASHGQVRPLVRRILREYRVPAAEQAQQREVPVPDPRSRLLEPCLVGLLGQERAAVPPKRLLGRLGVGIAQGPVREPDEVVQVDRDVVASREQGDQLAAQDERVGVPEGLAGVVGRLVQARCCHVGRDVGPEHVQRLLAVEPTAVAESE